MSAVTAFRCAGRMVTTFAKTANVGKAPTQGYLRNFRSGPTPLRLSGELGRLLTMHEIEAQFGFTTGKPVARVKASDLKALWKMCRDTEAHAKARNPELKRGQIGIGMELMKHVCGPEADVNAVYWRNTRLAMLMMRLGKQDVQPPAILFTIFAKLPMKWWAFGEPHRGLF
jgi:hypothetical protein